MSGLEGIAGLGLACNVMQLISFGHEAVSMCRRIYESGSPEPGLDDYAKSLKAVCDGLEKSLGKQPTPAPTVKTPLSEKRLLDLATKCVKHAKDLEEEMKYLSPSQSGTFGALATAPKVIWRKKRLERLRLNLADAQKIIDTSILERLFFKAEATYKMNKQGFSELSQELKAFIAQHAKSGSFLQDVVQNQSAEIRDHVTTESSKTQEVIKSHMSLELAHHGASVNEHVSLSAQGVQNALSQRMASREDSVAREQAYQQLLKSLKYPGMNERRNQVTQTHPRTFRWIFSSSMDLSDSESEYSTEDGSSADDDETESIDKSSTMSEESSESWDSSDSTASIWPQPWDSFVDWLTDDNRKRYWISGKPGSGKSTLMKYIETNDETIEYCKPGTRCISHFLWRPGTFMQQNIKGLLCSLLHQILADEKSIALRILDNQPSLSTKDSYTDWTVHELKTSLLDSIRKSACTYLVLLDGLDEVADTPDEGVGRLLHLIDELVATNQVKVCVSSRPEPALKRVLERCPMLKIQDLTDRDIRLLTRDRLEAMKIDLENDTTDELSDLICEKAEGVFIWVVLVLSSLQRGLDNYDDVDTLYRRVQSLPKDLTKLYKEMWSRMKEDGDLYRRKTVLLFYMAMELKEDSVLYEQTDNLLGLVFSTDDEILESFTSRYEIPDMGLLWERWHCLGRGLSARCAGLLDITGAEEAFSSHNTHESKFKSWGRTGIRFTHRTAIDFICNSEEGRELFGAHIPRRDDLTIRAIKKNLMFHRIQGRPDITSTTFPIKPTILPKPEGPHLLDFGPYHHLAQISSRRITHDLLSFAYRYLEFVGLDRQKRSLQRYSKSSLHHRFLAKAFYRSDFVDWAIETLQAATAGEEKLRMETLALQGACDGVVAFNFESSPETNTHRLSLIRRVLRNYSDSREGLTETPIQPVRLAYFKDISVAWRCLLMHTLEKLILWESAPRYNEKKVEWWRNVLTTIDCFSSAKVLEEVNAQRYIVQLTPGRGDIYILGRAHFELQWPFSSILFEVNDDAILTYIMNAASQVPGLSSLSKLPAKPAYCPIMALKAFNRPADGGIIRDFECHEIQQEGSISADRVLTMIIEGKIRNVDNLKSVSCGPSLLQTRKIGRFHDWFAALRAIGYEIGTVNRDYQCIEDIVFEMER